MSIVQAVTASEVKRANRRLYDAVAGDYEALDGRRDEALTGWIRRSLRSLAERHGRGVLLDIGSGSGVVPRAGRGLFIRTIALDLSPVILATSNSDADHLIAGDVDSIPLADESVDVVTCFAVLHHLYDSAALTREVARVLRPGGGFWSDHDMDSAFYRRFQRPLRGYRWLRRTGRKYGRDEYGLDENTYRLAEYRENGVDSQRLLGQFGEAGLIAGASYHWFGLTALTNRLFGHRRRSHGWAPLLRILAEKPGRGDGQSI
jgi:SAM-dependent methyltransferase